MQNAVFLETGRFLYSFVSEIGVRRCSGNIEPMLEAASHFSFLPRDVARSIKIAAGFFTLP